MRKLALAFALTLPLAFATSAQAFPGFKSVIRDSRLVR